MLIDKVRAAPCWQDSKEPSLSSRTIWLVRHRLTPVLFFNSKLPFSKSVRTKRPSSTPRVRPCRMECPRFVVVANTRIVPRSTPENEPKKGSALSSGFNSIPLYSALRRAIYPRRSSNGLRIEPGTNIGAPSTTIFPPIPPSRPCRSVVSFL